MTELERAHKQIESLAWRLSRIMAVCDQLHVALTHPASPQLAKLALTAHRTLIEEYPEPQPLPGRPLS